VAAVFGKKFLVPGDSILISAVEHHSNIVPWQMIAEEKGATLKVIPVDEHGDLIIDELDHLLKGVKLVPLTMSPIRLRHKPRKEIIAAAHRHGIPVLVDAAQAVQHLTVDVQDLDVDSSPSPVINYMDLPALVSSMARKNGSTTTPYQGGGEMIKTVTFERPPTTISPINLKREHPISRRHRTGRGHRLFQTRDPECPEADIVS